MAKRMRIRWKRLSWLVAGLAVAVGVIQYFVRFYASKPERTIECGWLQQQKGLQPGTSAGAWRLRKCLSAGRTSEVWLAEEEGKVVKIAKPTFENETWEVFKLRYECDNYQMLIDDGVTCVPGCKGEGMLEVQGGMQLPFSVRDLVVGRRVVEVRDEAYVTKSVPRELASLKSAFRATLAVFEVYDSGVRSCAKASGRECHYFTDVGVENVVLAPDGRAFVVDLDAINESFFRIELWDQPDLPQLSLDERMKECHTRGMFVMMLTVLTIGAGDGPELLLQLSQDLSFRGSKLDHCMTQGLRVSEVLLQASRGVSKDWLWDGKTPLSERHREPTEKDRAIGRALISRVPTWTWREEWEKLEGVEEVIVDAVASIRSYDIHWPPKFISSVQRWLAQLEEVK